MKIVFAGPSIYGAPLDLEGIDLRPPAACGDILRATLEGATVIGLIDGVFGLSAAVWHKEILYAMRRGVTVVGGASMGALRAAECAAFGMIPIGDIAMAYVDGTADDDAWVALSHGPAEFGSFPITEPMVDFEASVKALGKLALISAIEADLLLRAGRELHFTERTIEAAAARALEKSRISAVVEAYERHRVRLKTRDAALVIDHVRGLPAARVPPPDWQMNRTETFVTMLRQALEVA